ncbi:hypothetical protein R5R35_010743 [Gryllus longicercus]|uniref:C2H2-type domain-containing protein n=1 Tax=Gryllus longicercus TaxID=2509291 RepID=A0AAN9V6W0_9ORTH
MGLKSGSKSGKGVKQGASKLGQSKKTPPNASKPADSDDEPDIDTSVMRPSIEISVSTVPQLVRAYQAATEELKSILARECDIIYECRVCRNLFRSLANMMAHKRIYCKTTYSYTKHTLNRNHMVEDYTVLIQPEPVPSNSQDKQNWTTSDKVPDCSKEDENAIPQIVTTTSRISSFTNSKKGLREIVDRLAQNSCKSNNNETKTSSATKLYDNVHANVLARKNDRIEHSFHLEEIETTKVGVFQTKLASAVGAEKDDLMKAQVSELQHMASQNEATLGPDGRMLMVNRHSPISVQKGVPGKASESGVEANEHKVTKEEHVCPDCNVKFSTRKTLNHHMKSLHVTFRLCYPCPCCKSTFVNPWSVYRHLYKVHRKTADQVRRLRPQIQKKAFKKEIHNEVPVPKSNPKSDALKELQRLDQENQAWMDNFEDDLELQRCGGCGRRFERRAALNSHSQICQKRIAARNNVKATRNLQSTSSPEKVIKVSQTDERRLPTEANKNTNNENKSIVSVNTILNPLGSTRTPQGGSWVDQPKKEIPEKKIEIQIRKDYCKMSSASSVVALSNDTQSEPDSRPPSRMVDDEDCSVDERDWDSMIEMEEVSKEESESEYHLFRDAEGPDLLMNDDGKEDEDTVGTNSPVEHSATDMELNSSVQDNVLDRYDVRKDNFCMYGRAENVLKRRVSDDGTCLQKNEDKERLKRRRKSLEDENYNDVEDTTKSIPSKTKKLEQFHPVMEARMKKLINIRRLQCLPCQKKFIKLTNLRRHVAVHIGWCRYKCMLCPFKCFSKYDCVDHVCKIHLKGSQRSKAATMVEYIEEQETEATEGSVEIEESNDCCDIVSNEEEASESLSVEIKSLNLEDIKNIVGVTCFSDDVNKTDYSSLALEVKTSSPSPEHSSENNTLLISEGKKDVLGSSNVQTVDAIEEFHDIILKEESTKSNENKFDSSARSEVIEDELQKDNILPGETTNVSDDLSKTEQIGYSESVCIDVEEREQSKDDSELRLEPCCLGSDETEDVVGDEPKQFANVSGDTHIEEDSLRNSDEPGGKEEISDTTSEVICDEYEQNSTPLVMKEDSQEHFKEQANTNNKKCDSMECYYQASEVECAEEMIVREEQELEPEQPMESTGETSDTDDNMSAVDCKSEEEEDDDEKEDKEPSELMGVSNSPRNPEKDENALRKMVMEVIFGSGGTSDSHPDTNQNLISATVNGSVFDEDGSSSDGRYSRASSASESDVVIVSNHVTSPSSEIVKKDVEIEHGHSFEGERRERPVRNRVKVEKEDFIYDFTDSFLKKEEPSKVGNNIGGNTSGKKKLGDSGKESVKYDHSHNSTLFKSVPKMMIVRTDASETAGSKCVTGPIKGSWSSVYAPTSDCAGNKNYMESNSQTCSSSRKVPRTYDVKQ